ncbi:RusA family crossover junction endodeoxyribonuclease [Amycolatopsis thermoflava]|uniref:hypothetical protein n=1 Tax=Amycolatopsis thermoflava TaxID=84480 RepID=UPI00381357A9
MTATTLRFKIEVPMMRRRAGGPPEPPLSENDRWHHMQRAQRTQVIRLGVRDAARKAGIPTGSHLTVTLHYAPGDNRRRDADNLVPTLKAACDALARGRNRRWIGLELVPDDTPQHMTKHMPVIHPGRGPRRLWLEIEVTP